MTFGLFGMELFSADLNPRPSRYSANAQKQNFRKLEKRKGFHGCFSHSLDIILGLQSAVCGMQSA